MFRSVFCNRAKALLTASPATTTATATITHGSGSMLFSTSTFCNNEINNNMPLYETTKADSSIYAKYTLSDVDSTKQWGPNVRKLMQKTKNYLEPLTEPSWGAGHTYITVSVYIYIII